MRALIDGQEVDIAPDELPAFTFSIEDSLDIGSSRGARSTTMRLPMTNRNRRVIGGQAIGERATDSFTFSVRNGTASYFDGVCLVRERTPFDASVVAFGDNASWMSKMSGKRLHNLNLGHAKVQTATNTVIRDSWDGSKDYVFPLVDYGSLEGRAAGYDVPFDKMHPALFIGKAMSKAFAGIDFGIVGKGSFADKWDKLIALPVNGPVYALMSSDGAIDIDNQSAASATVGPGAGTYQCNPIGSVPDIYPFGIATDGLLSAIGATGTYTAPASGFTGIIHANIYYEDTTGFLGLPNLFAAVLWNQTTGQALAGVQLPAIPPLGNDYATVNFGELTIQAGHVVYIGLVCAFPQPAFTVPAAPTVVWGGLRILQESPIGADEIDLAEILPDTDVLSLLGSICRAFCVLPVTKGNLVELWHYDELFPQIATQPIDITKRQVGEPVKQTEDLPSAIVFKHAEDIDDRALDVIKAGGFTVRHEVGGPSEEQTVEVLFAPTAMDTVMGLRIPAIRSRDSEATGGFYPEKLKHETRIMFYDGLRAGSWTFNGGAETQYPSAYSYGNGSTSFMSVHFKDRPKQRGTVNSHWVFRLRRWTAPRLKLDAVWADHEIAALDVTRQVKASDGIIDGIYYVLEINQHRFGIGEPSETTLVPL